MKTYLVCALMLLVVAAHAAAPVAPGDEDEGPVLPPTPPDAQGLAIDITPEDKAEILQAAQMVRAMAEPMVCADLTATPTPLPNGDYQYPVVPCSSLNVVAPLGVPVRAGQGAAARPATPAAAQAPVGVPQVGEGSRLQAPAVADSVDFNTLQMKRLGTFDAMQGRPLNMNHASNLGYVQGYTEGQQRRMMPQSGGFGGFNR
ncbi:MAG: hypothetical protein EON60_11740 [Alphaproteobacteria bacterium]|nr:MAG: hypothetical protein EON60_11740 [Alphaproteobacteria bacterium]